MARNWAENRSSKQMQKPTPAAPDGLLDFAHVRQRQRERLLDDEMLARARRRDGLLLVLMVIAANRDDVDVRVGQHRGVVRAGLEGAAVLGGEFRARPASATSKSASPGRARRR